MLFVVIAIVVVILPVATVAAYIIDKRCVEDAAYGVGDTVRKIDELTKLYISLEDKEAKKMVDAAIEDQLGVLRGQQENIKSKEHEALMERTEKQIKKICK